MPGSGKFFKTRQDWRVQRKIKAALTRLPHGRDMVSRRRLRTVLTALCLYAMAAALIGLFRHQCLYRQSRPDRQAGYRPPARRTDRRNRPAQGRAQCLGPARLAVAVGPDRSRHAGRAGARAPQLCTPKRRHSVCETTLIVARYAILLQRAGELFDYCRRASGMPRLRLACSFTPDRIPLWVSRQLTVCTCPRGRHGRG